MPTGRMHGPRVPDLSEDSCVLTTLVSVPPTEGQEDAVTASTRVFVCGWAGPPPPPTGRRNECTNTPASENPWNILGTDSCGSHRDRGAGEAVRKPSLCNNTTATKLPGPHRAQAPEKLFTRPRPPRAPAVPASPRPHAYHCPPQVGGLQAGSRMMSPGPCLLLHT